MFAGPIFNRETLTQPRQPRHFLIRSGYVAALFVLMYTAGQATFGWQQIRNVGDIARYGTLVFQIFSVIQLSLVMFFSMLFAAGRIAQEKDRQTLILLLMTDLREREMVLGKLYSSLLLVAVLLGVSIPVFVFVHLLGGVAVSQIFWSLALCAATALATGSWGTLVAFWRDKTFQTLAVSVLGLVVYLGALEAVIAVVGTNSVVGQFVSLLNPVRSLLLVLDPLGSAAGANAAMGSVIALLALAVGMICFTIFRLRAWNPSRVTFLPDKADDDDATEKSKHRRIWNNPVIWREIKTRAYGRKIILIKLVYLMLAAFVASKVATTQSGGELVLGMISSQGFAFVGLALLTLLLVNAQAVTALTTEKDMKTLELLLVTDITAKEFMFGKIGGILYNTKELVLVPVMLAGYFAYNGVLAGESFLYVTVGYFLLVMFSAMLGLHGGLSFDSSRSSIANSLGTMFFLFIGIFIFMILLVEARSSFFLQFQSFIAFIGVGSIGLWASLTHKNPSAALGLAAGILPFLTFYALTEFLLEGSLSVCISIGAAYGFTTLAMLIPAVSEFDVALGRTTLDKG